MTKIEMPFWDTILSETGPPFPGGGRPENDTRIGSLKVTTLGSISAATRFFDPKTFFLDSEMVLKDLALVPDSFCNGKKASVRHVHTFYLVVLAFRWKSSGHSNIAIQNTAVHGVDQSPLDR